MRRRVVFAGSRMESAGYATVISGALLSLSSVRHERLLLNAISCCILLGSRRTDFLLSPFHNALLLLGRMQTTRDRQMNYTVCRFGVIGDLSSVFFLGPAQFWFAVSRCQSDHH